MPMSAPFARGQIFVSADSTGRRVQVISAGHHRPNRVYVGTISASGKLVRQRWMHSDQFHDTVIAKTGARRITGYILESAMSKELKIGPEVDALARAAGLEPSQVSHIEVDPMYITFEVGGPDGTMVTHPWGREA